MTALRRAPKTAEDTLAWLTTQGKALEARIRAQMAKWRREYAKHVVKAFPAGVVLRCTVRGTPMTVTVVGSTVRYGNLCLIIVQDTETGSRYAVEPGNPADIDKVEIVTLPKPGKTDRKERQ